MIIDGITSSPAYSIPVPTVAEEPAPPQQDPPPQPVDAEGTDDGETRGEGVLRLLQAGHFNGVADVRLRTNFHDEMVAAQIEATKSAAGEAATNLSQVMNGELDQLGSSGELDEEQALALGETQDAFNQAVGDATQTFLAAGDVQGGVLTQGLQEAFDQLVGAVDSILVGAEAPAPDGAEEPGGGEELTADSTLSGMMELPGEPEPEPQTRAPSEALEELFEAAMLELNDALANTSLFPPVSASGGHGAAFEKFLGEYNSLQALDGATGPGTEGTDTADESVNLEA